MAEKSTAFRLVTLTFCLSLFGLLTGIVFMVNTAQDDTDTIRRIEEAVKVEIRYTLYKGAHHDLYLTADHPPVSRQVSNVTRTKVQATHTVFTSRSNDWRNYQIKKNLSGSYFASIPSNLKPFLTKLSVKDSAVLSNLLTVFLGISSHKNISYLLHGGSLVGAYRHHGLIPWDTDIDIWVNIKDKEKLIDAISDLGSKYEYVLHYDRLIFYEEHTSPVANYPWKFPYIDISFFKYEGNKVFDMNETAAVKFAFPSQWILPPVSRPFWGRMLASPRKSAYVIQKNYNLSLCETNKYNHREGRPRSSRASVSCHVLYKYLPFVFRKSAAEFTKEELRLGKRVLEVFWMPK